MNRHSRGLAAAAAMILLTAGCSGQIIPAPTKTMVDGKRLTASEVQNRLFSSKFDATLASNGVAVALLASNDAGSNTNQRTMIGARADLAAQVPVTPTKCAGAFGEIVDVRKDAGRSDPYFISKNFRAGDVVRGPVVAFYVRVFRTSGAASAFMISSLDAREKCEGPKQSVEVAQSSVSEHIVGTHPAGDGFSYSIDANGAFFYSGTWSRVGNVIVDVNVNQHNSVAARAQEVVRRAVLLTLSEDA